MSRIGKLPVVLPQGVEVKFDGQNVAVKGPKGEVSGHIPGMVNVSVEDGKVVFTQIDESRESNASTGTARALVNDYVKGVTVGFEKKLTLIGVGFRAQVQGDKLNLQLGFSHPVVHTMPAGIKCETPSQTEIVIKGADKQLVGQTAAVIRSYRSPEPYKGKGIRYADEHVVIKETKKK